MEYDDSNPEHRKHIERVAASVMERMTVAGWIQSARTKDVIGIQWTETGKEAARQFRSLFDQLGDTMFSDELGFLLHVIDDMSPYGKSHPIDD